MLKLTDMPHGLFILASVLTVVLVFNFFAIKAFKLPAAKRKKYRQIALVFYGFLMLCIGVIFLKSGENPLSGWFYLLFGIGFPVVSWMEYRTKKKLITPYEVAPQERRSFHGIWQRCA